MIFKMAILILISTALLLLALFTEAERYWKPEDKRNAKEND